MRARLSLCLTPSEEWSAAVCCLCHGRQLSLSYGPFSCSASACGMALMQDAAHSSPPCLFCMRDLLSGLFCCDFTLFYAVLCVGLARLSVAPLLWWRRNGESLQAVRPRALRYVACLCAPAHVGRPPFCARSTALVLAARPALISYVHDVRVINVAYGATLLQYDIMHDGQCGTVNSELYALSKRKWLPLTHYLITLFFCYNVWIACWAGYQR